VEGQMSQFLSKLYKKQGDADDQSKEKGCQQPPAVEYKFF